MLVRERRRSVWNSHERRGRASACTAVIRVRDVVGPPARRDDRCQLRTDGARFGEREALVDRASGRRWTYAQLNVDVDTLARGLLARGIAKGERVGIWAPNCAEWVIVQYATAKAGVILVNVNPAYRAHELTYVLNQSGVSLLVVGQATDRSDYPAIVRSVRGDCPRLAEVVVIGTDSWDSLVGAASHVAPETLDQRVDTLSFDDSINIQYTSGTTGFPKGATSRTTTS